MFRGLLQRLLRGAKGASAHSIPEDLKERLAFQILAQTLPKALRGCLFKWRLGGCRGIPLVGRGVRISNAHLIRCGHGFAVEDYAEIQGLSRAGVRFGDNVTIGRGAQIRPSSYYGRNVGVGLEVGDDSNIGSLCYIGASGGVTIGRRVLMGPGVTVLSEEHNFDDPNLDIKTQGVRPAPTVVQDDVWIGAGAIVLGGTTVGKGSVVAAGAVVRDSIAPYSVAAGVPARVVRSRQHHNPLQ